MKNTKNVYLDLFLTFAKIGATTFGGGYAMLPMLTRNVVHQKKWATEEDIMDYYAIGQCTPGVIAVNTATFIGTKIAGVLGGIVATLGIIFPSIVIITIIASFLSLLSSVELVSNIFKGIRLAVCGMVTINIAKLAKKAAVDIPAIIIMVITFAGIVLFEVSPVIIVLVAAVAGIVIQAIKENRKHKHESEDENGVS